MKSSQSVVIERLQHNLVLRTLPMVGIFQEIEPKVFANTPVSETLLSNVPNSLREMTIWLGEEPHWRVYG